MGAFEVTVLVKVKPVWEYSEDKLKTVHSDGNVLEAIQHSCLFFSVNIRPEHNGYHVGGYRTEHEVIESFRVVEEPDELQETWVAVKYPEKSIVLFYVWWVHLVHRGGFIAVLLRLARGVLFSLARNIVLVDDWSLAFLFLVVRGDHLLDRMLQYLRFLLLLELLF